MPWQLRDPVFREAIHELVERMEGGCLLAGTAGVQVHVAAAIGLEKLGPPAHAIDVVPLGNGPVPQRCGVVPVEVVDHLGFQTSVAAGRREIAIGDERFPVASPEHVLGMRLAAPDLPADAQWACFVLMRVYEGQLDLEEVRGFLKRSSSMDRQALLAELAYLAA